MHIAEHLSNALRDRYHIEREIGRGATQTGIFLIPGNISAARLSPNGRWVACQSDETGAPEVYVRAPATLARAPLT
jgi:Tol biopolymer transport system component